MKPTLRFFLLILLYQLHSQNLQWGHGLVGAGTQNIKAMKLYNGHLYCAGVFANTIDLDPGPGTFEITSNGQKDIFVVRYDTDGNFVDGYNLGGAGDEGAYPGLCFDPSGNYYLTYQFSGTIDADPGAANVPHTATGAPSCVVAKFSPTHTLLWSFSMEAGTAETGNGIVADNQYVYLTGHFIGTTDFDPSPSTANLTASATGLYVAKYTNTGNYKWAFLLDNEAINATGNNIRVDANGFVVVGGHFRGTVDFNPSPTSDSIITSYSTGILDFFLARYDSTSAFQWAHHAGDTSTESITYAMELIGSDIVIGGYVNGTEVDLDPGAGEQLVTTGEGDAYLARFNSDGSLEWAKTFGGSQYEDVMCLGITPTGNIVITGGFRTDTVDIDPGPSVTNISINKADGTFDAYVALFDGNGNYQWAMAMGDSSWDQGQALVIDTYDNWYIGGWYGKQEIDLDPSAATVLLPGNDNEESFVLKLSPCILMKPTLAANLQFKEDAAVAIPCVLTQGTAVEYHWHKGATLLSSGASSSYGFSQIAFADEGLYRVKTTDACANNKWSSEVNLTVIPTIKVYELISPNGDDKNEFFNIRNIDKFSNHRIVVFNRWGQQVFQSGNYSNDWNGESLPDGTYFYKVTVGEEEYKGSLLIKR